MAENNENNYFDLENPQQVKPSGEAYGQEPRQGAGFLTGLLVGLLGALVISGGVYLGNRLQARLQTVKGGDDPIVFAEDSAITSKVVNKLELLEKTIDDYYYLEEITDEELTDGIYKGMLNALGDPYSEYYTAEELDTIMEQMEGTYYGIGAYVSLDNDLNIPKIAGVIAGSPAEEAQLRADVLIYEVNGESTYGLTLTKAVSMIKGPEGTEVVLTIYREGEPDYLKVSMIRRRVDTPNVEYEMLDERTGYIHILEFGDSTVDQFADALATVKGSGMEGLIIDLRANPGGSLTAVVDICRMLLPEGMIVYTEDKYGERVEYTCDGTRQLEVPLVVLVDGNSASASEIMSGAIKDYGIGTLVGTTTFGKGIVQQVMPLRDGSAIKLTVSSYFTPNGNNIHGTGIEPDVECEFDGEAYYGSEEHPDNQLDKAREVLEELMK
ncbi:MAG: S41 family peptidase [Lachnospiraceae bacterium]|nr:S41 family peptidase [Lachnospiraceae bacterium]